MNRDILSAILVCLATVALGVMLFVWPQSGRFQDLDEEISQQQALIASDQAYIAAFPQLLKKEQSKIAVLQSVQAMGSDTDVEQAFFAGLDQVVRRDHLGVRPISLEAAFSPSVAIAGPVSAATPAPTGTATPLTASKGAGDALPVGLGNGPTGQFFKNSGSIELVGTWANILHGISDLSGLPVLLEVQGVTLERDSSTLSKANDPSLDARVNFTLYRIAAATVPSAMPPSPTPASVSAATSLQGGASK